MACKGWRSGREDVAITEEKLLEYEPWVQRMVFDHALARHGLQVAGKAGRVEFRGAAFERLRRRREIPRCTGGPLRAHVVEPALEPAEHHRHGQLLQVFRAG